ncbi:MAG: hypothetical protein AB7K71_00760 [Polyangiaceae bacterium]
MSEHRLGCSLEGIDGYRIDDALARVREVHPIAYTAPGWYAAVSAPRRVEARPAA